MKKIISGSAAILLLILLLFSVSFAEDAVNPEQAEHHTNTSVVLIADDGFASLQAEKNISVQEIMDVYIAVVEEMGNAIHLQGVTSNNNSSSLRYRTEDGKTIDWNSIPTKADANTFRYSINSLNRDGYSDYDQIVILSGHMGQSDTTAIRKLNSAVPTYLFQALPYEDGSTLLSRYTAVAGLTISERTQLDSFGNVYYSINGNEAGSKAEIHFADSSVSNAGTLLQRMFLGSVFEGVIPVSNNTFSVPVSFVDEIYLMIDGTSLEDVRLISPDGTRYPVTSETIAQDNTVHGHIYPMSGNQYQVVSLRNIRDVGEWKIESSGEIKSAALFYTLKDGIDFSSLNTDIVNPELNGTVIEKGVLTFKTMNDPLIRDLFALYPSLRLRVTDSVNNAIESESTASDEQTDRIDIPFRTGGKHALVIRLVNGEKEIIKQTLEIEIIDKDPVFNREEGEEIVVYSDTLNDNEWSCSVEGWFSDPDGDQFVITKVGGDSNRISFADNTIKLHLEANVLDGSEDVILNAKSDTKEIKGTVKIVWRNLKTQIDNIRFTPSNEIMNEGETPEKRGKIRIRIQASYTGPDEERILQELEDCEAEIKDQAGNVVADAAFDKKNKEFLSTPFELPANAGEFKWTLFLHSKENKRPEWSYSVETDKVEIKNHAPAMHPEELLDDLLGEQYAFNTEDWRLEIPRNLVTDPDNDPINYHITILEKGKQDANTYTILNDDENKQVVLPNFGNFTITIQGEDNDGISSEEITKEIQLTDLKKELESLKGKIFTVPVKEQFTKREAVKLILQFASSDWTVRKKEVISDWLKKCIAEVSIDGKKIDETVKYNEENQTFTAEIKLPDKGNKYEYMILLKNQPEETPEVTVRATNPYVMEIVNHQPETSADSEFADKSVWVMKAEEYKELIIPQEAFQDQDDDTIQYTLELKQKNKEEPVINGEIITLPYTFSFAPFDFFELSREYQATVSVSDSDAEPVQQTMVITLKNKQLLFIIIGAAVLLLLIIIAIILYAVHRKNLPTFDGTVYFTYKGKEVSGDIQLKPWNKDKNIPLTIFAGSISTLLDNEQWEKMKKMELRPNKRTGFELYQVKAKQNASESMPYEISNGLSINKR